MRSLYFLRSRLVRNKRLQNLFLSFFLCCSFELLCMCVLNFMRFFSVVVSMFNRMLCFIFIHSCSWLFDSRLCCVARKCILAKYLAANDDCIFYLKFSSFIKQKKEWWNGGWTRLIIKLVNQIMISDFIHLNFFS